MKIQNAKSMELQKKKNHINFLKICPSKNVFVSLYAVEDLIYLNVVEWLIVENYHSLWSSPCYVLAQAVTSALIWSASNGSPTWLVSHSAQCAGEHPTSGLPSKITKLILSLFYHKSLHWLSVAYEIPLTPRMLSEALHIWPHPHQCAPSH